jgi:hypothetical protein
MKGSLRLMRRHRGPWSWQTSYLLIRTFRAALRNVVILQAASTVDLAGQSEKASNLLVVAQVERILY